MKSDIHGENEISAAELQEAIASAPQFEAALREAAAVPVPEGLADRILARQAIASVDPGANDNVVSLDRARTPSAGHSKPLVPRWMAVAASVLIVIGLVGVTYFGRDPSTVLEQRIVVALNNTMPMYDKMVVNNEIDPNIQQNLHELMQMVGLKKVGDMGQIYYCESKSISGSTSAIMVVPGKMGAITVVYLMDKQVKERRNIDSPSMAGVLWPEPKGTVAVIGHKGDPMLGDVEQQVKRSMQWF